MFKILKLTAFRANIRSKLSLSCNSVFIPKRTVTFQCQDPLSEDDILDALYPDKAPVYNRIPDFIKEKKASVQTTKEDSRTKKDVVISCKNSSLNHYRNQKYEKRIGLASNGWNNIKSKGDYFTVKVCDDEDYIHQLFWDAKTNDFDNFQLDASLVEALAEIGFKRPTKIQAKSIPTLLSGWNSLVTAETGCGKTLAYLIPVINQLLVWIKQLPIERKLNSPLALILAPSRDLAQQIGNVALKLSYLLPFRCNVLVGGRTKKKMLNPQFEQVDLQISTLGALTKFVSTGLYDLSNVKHVVLDEGDTMLDDSFNDGLVRLLRKIKIRYRPTARMDEVPNNSQLSIVSATMPRSIYDILGDFIETDSLRKVSTDRTHQVLPHVCQTFYRLGSTQKPGKLLQLVKESLKNGESIMIFSNRTKTCDWISMMLNENGIQALQLNGAMPEILRRDMFREFQQGDCKVLSCTDIASRGLDTVNVRHIINYEFPKFMADYLHRCGRTGRVGSHSKCGISSFVATENDVRLVQEIETAVRCMNQLPNVNGNISKIIHHRYLKFNEGKS